MSKLTTVVSVPVQHQFDVAETGQFSVEKMVSISVLSDGHCIGELRLEQNRWRLVLPNRRQFEVDPASLIRWLRNDVG